MKLRLRDDRILTFPPMKVMGILNLTPDSFYARSRVPSHEEAVLRAKKMIEDGAEILDIGGESSRPGSDPVSPEEEISRIVPVIRELKRAFPETLLSVDTYHSATIEAALTAGADIANDITALADPAYAKIVSEAGAPVILMHMQGEPKTMQENPHYDDVVEDVLDFLKERADRALAAGIAKDRIMIDPGIGFGKTYEQNMELIRNIDRFHVLELPVLLAVSRKSFIGNALGLPDPKDRLEGTMAVSAWAATNGIEMIRVHDVLENTRIVRMMEEII